jgi:hypothetical protein
MRTKMALIVVNPFGNYRRGQQVAAADEASVLASHRRFVVPVKDRPAPTPAPVTPAAPAATK